MNHAGGTGRDGSNVRNGDGVISRRCLLSGICVALFASGDLLGSESKGRGRVLLPLEQAHPNAGLQWRLRNVLELLSE